MQPELLGTLQEWVVSALVYPGLLFGVALALIAEWALQILRPALTARSYRPAGRAPRRHLAQPLHNFLKLAGRQGAAGQVASSGLTGRSGGGLPGLASLLAPALALALFPFPGSPALGSAGPVGDLLLLLALLAVQPLCRGALLLRGGGMSALRGARELGRLITGLFPTLFALAALVEASTSRSLQVASLQAAPDTGAQFLARLLAGLALLAALPWWLDARDAGEQTDAAAYAGTFVQRAALAAFWALLVLPAPGVPAWAAALYVGGSLVAYVAMRLVAERWAAARRERDAAGLVWAAALPLAIVALGAAIWSGA